MNLFGLQLFFFIATLHLSVFLVVTCHLRNFYSTVLHCSQWRYMGWSANIFVHYILVFHFSSRGPGFLCCDLLKDMREEKNISGSV